MSARNPDPLLSAFFDGEVTPAERETVEQRLPASPAEQQELADFARLSHWLQALPVATLPDEFPNEVLHAIERRSLLNPAPIATDAVEPAGTSRSEKTPEKSLAQWKMLIPLLATAAVLCVMVQSWPVSDPGTMFVTESETTKSAEMKYADRTSPSLEANRFAKEAPLLAENGVTLSDHVSDKARWPEAAAAPPPPAMGAARGGQPPIDGTEALDEEEAELALQNAVIQGANAPPQFVFRKSLENVDVGSVVEAFDTEQVAVVRLWVVDRQEGLDKLRVLLARNEVQMDDSDSDGAVADAPAPPPGEPAASPPAPVAPGGIGKAEERDPQSAELVAVYVEATNDQLAATIEALSQEEVLIGFDVQGEMAYASADDQFARNRPLDERLAEKRRSLNDVRDANREQERADRKQAGESLKRSGKPGDPKPGEPQEEKAPAERGRGELAQEGKPAAAANRARAENLGVAKNMPAFDAFGAKSLRNSRRKDNSSRQILVTIQPEMQEQLNGSAYAVAPKSEAQSKPQAADAAEVAKDDRDKKRPSQIANARRPALQVLFLVQQPPAAINPE